MALPKNPIPPRFGGMADQGYILPGPDAATRDNVPAISIPSPPSSDDDFDDRGLAIGPTALRPPKPSFKNTPQRLRRRHPMRH